MTWQDILEGVRRELETEAAQEAEARDRATRRASNRAELAIARTVNRYGISSDWRPLFLDTERPVWRLTDEQHLIELTYGDDDQVWLTACSGITSVLHQRADRIFTAGDGPRNLRTLALLLVDPHRYEPPAVEAVAS